MKTCVRNIEDVMRKNFVLRAHVLIGVLVGGIMWGSMVYNTAALAVTKQVKKADPHEWIATGCGDEPRIPKVDMSTVQRYNISVDKVGAYEKAARVYNSCVSKAALKEETEISNEARAKIAYVHEGSAAVQKRISSVFEELTADLKEGGAKLQKAAQ